MMIKCPTCVLLYDNIIDKWALQLPLLQFHEYFGFLFKDKAWFLPCLPKTLLMKLCLSLREEHRLKEGCLRTSLVARERSRDRRMVKIIQGDSVARGPKLLSIKNYVIELMTWKFIYTYRERRITGPAHNWCWNWSPFTSKHTWMRFSKFWNTFPKVSSLMAWISWRIASLSCSVVQGVFLYTLPFNRLQRN